MPEHRSRSGVDVPWMSFAGATTYPNCPNLLGHVSRTSTFDLYENWGKISYPAPSSLTSRSISLSINTAKMATQNPVDVSPPMNDQPNDFVETSGSHLSEPPFWDDQLHRIPWCLQLLEKAETIRTEILALIQNFRPFMPYPKYANLYNNTWDAFPLSIFLGEHIELSKQKLAVNMAPLIRMFRAKLPVTSSTIDELEAQGHLRNVFVSRLIPGSVINPHRGWTNNYLRVHLCLVEDSGCNITVGSITRTWRRGQLLAFKDGGPFLHSVLHQGQHERIILSYDLNLHWAAGFIPELLSTAGVATGNAAEETGPTADV